MTVPFTLIHLKILRDKFLRVIFYNFLISLKNTKALMAKIKIKFILFVIFVTPLLKDVANL